jgi:EAL domain-containing protein (putative c-di-GMP-specific phosphodiesterase class I)/FixJ family two-component response regulator
MKILILDDDPFVLKLLPIQLRALGLKQRGYVELVSCDRGQAAVEVLQREGQRIHLIFCDLQMPEMDGIEFVRHLVRLDYRGGLVLFSGEDQRILQAAEQLARAHGLRVLGALHKPVPPSELRRMLDETLAGIPDAGAATASYEPDALRRALAAGELENHYQPKVDLATGAVVGMEALARWRHPDDGLVLPARFIPVAERAGLAGELARVVLSAALRDTARWHAAGHVWDVSVNVSLGSLSSLDFPDLVARLAEEAGVPARHLVLEVTESQMMTDRQSQLDILTRLRLKRVRLSIDDFGTGYSFMTQLRDLPVDELKVDRSFVHGAAREPQLRAMLEASLGLARQLGITAVAEGVEERADWDLLRAAGCDLAQGFLIARPMPATAVEDWFAQWHDERLALVA